MKHSKNFYLYVSIFLCVPLVLSSCAAVSDKAKHQLSKDVDCRTARYDIEILEGEKASVEKMALTGASVATPAGAALTILSGQAADKASVVSGDYNRRITAKIAEIEDVCGVDGLYD